jgi:hypothetical protein
VKTLEIEHRKLRFFVDNPRIYSLLKVDDEKPSQEEIESQLQEMEHVRELVLDIKRNGGLIDPLIVRDGSYDVLEGNSRLAAYRQLARNEPIKWGRVKCTLLPKDLPDSVVFALLGQYHVKGKKAWQPFEQAGFLYRRFKEHKLDYKTLAEEIGLSKTSVKHLVETYQFMQDHDEPPNRWSYYDEYLKSTKIQRARREEPDLDAVVVRAIKKGKIKRAVDVRAELPQICHVPRALQKFVEEKVDFDRARELAQNAGADNVHYLQVERFRKRICEDSFMEVLLNSEPAMQKKFMFEVGKIENRLKTIRAKVGSQN